MWVRERGRDQPFDGDCFSVVAAARHSLGCGALRDRFLGVCDFSAGGHAARRSDRNRARDDQALSDRVPSVVHVFARASQGLSLFEPEETVVQSGSGIIWDAAGHVVTNNHVISGTNEIGARFETGEFVAARLIGTAPNYDIAVLQLERVRTVLRPIIVGASADLQVGQAAYAIGNPYGLGQTLTSGIISALNRRLPTSTPYEVQGVIQTDAAVNPGTPAGRCSTTRAG